IEPVMAQAEASMKERQLPFALVMSEGSVADHALSEQPQPGRVECGVSGRFKLAEQQRMIRTEALQAVLDSLGGNEAVIATTGKTGRELFTIADRPNHLYVVGGMGTASAIGFGVAHALPRQPVVVIDG